MDIGIIGAGHIGATAAKLFVRAGHRVTGRRCATAVTRTCRVSSAFRFSLPVTTRVRLVSLPS
ncbi:MAG: hypothetical protein JO309_10790 [Pseudonocardiales bacterium]|nr:hypothetical protein [Pseudonocardiales bacterium]MBV9729868.1 hypothetical protein [Pseudonocardiales bacterium]